MSGFGSFVGGLFEGAQFGVNLLKARNDLEIQTMTIDAAKKAQAAADAQVVADKNKPGVASGPVPDPTNTNPVEPPPSVKPALKPDEKPGTQTPQVAVGATDKIAPIVSAHESSDRAYVGYTSPDTLKNSGWNDLSNAPPMKDNFGFPDWKGDVNPETGQISRAAGLYQIQPEQWRKYAPIAGVNDFSPESQRKVFDAMYAAEGVKPWNANRNLIAALGQANLLGGAAAPAVQPSALSGPPPAAPAKPPAAPAPQTPQQKADAVRAKAVSTVAQAFGGGGTTQTAQQKTEPVTPPKTEMAAIPAPAVAAAPHVAAYVAPAADTVGSAMVSSPQASALGVAPPITVQAPGRGAVLASMRQDSGGLNLPQPPRPRTFRMPNGALVDGIGNIIRPSALYPGTDNA